MMYSVAMLPKMNNYPGQFWEIIYPPTAQLDEMKAKF